MAPREIKEAARILKPVVRRIRCHWPRVEIMVRGADHYGTPEVMEPLESRGRGYPFGLSGNARPGKISHPWREATFETLCRAFLKVVVRIEELKSRVRFALPSAYPYCPALIATAGRLPALGP